MRTDYPDPADEAGTPCTPDRSPLGDDPRPGVASVSPSDPVERDAVHRNYYAQVERAKAAAAALDAWLRAATEFRAEWKQYEERHPKQARPTPQNHPDGSWSCGDTRKLTPDQNAEVSRGYARIREVGERDIVPGILAVAAADPTRHLAGFEHHIKGEDRLKEQAADLIRVKGRTPAEALAEIPDVVRFAFKYYDSTYAAGVRNDVERLKERGFIQVERCNSWEDDQDRGINARWRAPISGVLFEVRFHTRASLEANELTHKARERMRSTADDGERAELEEFRRRVNSKVPIPPGATEIEDYPP